MASFRNIQEQVDFSEPRVRFIRKNGRIIPIVNRRKVGQDLRSAGNTAVGAGLVGLGVKKAPSTAAAVARILVGDSTKGKRVRAIAKNKYVFKAASGFAKQTSKFILGRKATFGIIEDIDRLRNSRLGKPTRATGRAAKTLLKFGSRNMGKLGLASLAIGAGLNVVGSDLQLDSPRGLDY